jgi:hypothetical protein
MSFSFFVVDAVFGFLRGRDEEDLLDDSEVSGEPLSFLEALLALWNLSKLLFFLLGIVYWIWNNTKLPLFGHPSFSHEREESNWI